MNACCPKGKYVLPSVVTGLLDNLWAVKKSLSRRSLQTSPNRSTIMHFIKFDLKWVKIILNGSKVLLLEHKWVSCNIKPIMFLSAQILQFSCKSYMLREQNIFFCMSFEQLLLNFNVGLQNAHKELKELEIKPHYQYSLSYVFETQFIHHLTNKILTG